MISWNIIDFCSLLWLFASWWSPSGGHGLPTFLINTTLLPTISCDDLLAITTVHIVNSLQAYCFCGWFVLPSLMSHSSEGRFLLSVFPQCRLSQAQKHSAASWHLLNTVVEEKSVNYTMLSASKSSLAYLSGGTRRRQKLWLQDLFLLGSFDPISCSGRQPWPDLAHLDIRKVWAVLYL